MKLSILVPVYNDKDYIQQTINQIKAVTFPVPYEIVAVDDASTDGSKEILESISGITKIFHKKNTGKGGAIATGLKHVTGDIVAIQDDDCEYDPAVLPSLIQPILRNEADVVYGSRFLQKNSMFFIQKLENIAITTLANILIGQKLTDIETGHKVFTRNIANKITLIKKGFEFDMEITLQFLRNNAKIKELPTKYTARTHAQGKKITYKDGIRSIFTLFRLVPAQRIKALAIWITFLCMVFIPRLWGLGHILTIDEPLWLSRGATFINAFSTGNFARTLVAGQPGVTTAWLSGLSSPWHSLAAGQASIGIATGILILLNTYFLRRVIGNTWGLVTGMLLALDPFLLAHSRIVHTDALLALFYLASITGIFAAFAKKNPIKRYIIASGALGAGAILTKVFGILLIPTVIGIIFFYTWKKRLGIQTVVQYTGIWLSTFALITFLAWPALWVSANNVYELLFSRASLHAGGTRTEETTATDWYYAREALFRLSVPTTILLPFGLWQILKNRKQSKQHITLLLAGLFFFAILSTGSDKSDRYLLFFHLTLICIAPLGMQKIIQILQQKNLGQWAPLIIILPILYLAVDNVRLYPYYLAHYNRLYPIEKTHKLGWGEGLEQAGLWMSTHHPKAKVLSYYPRVFSYFFPGDVETITHIDDANGNYAILYRSMFERGEDSGETDILNEYLNSSKYKPEHTIYINGLPYAWIIPLT